MLTNAWAHAKAQADHKRSTWHCQHIEVTINRNYLPVKTLPDLPYSEDYLELLDDINEDKITYEDIGSQLTSTKYLSKGRIRIRWSSRRLSPLSYPGAI